MRVHGPPNELHCSVLKPEAPILLLDIEYEHSLYASLGHHSGTPNAVPTGLHSPCSPRVISELLPQELVTPMNVHQHVLVGGACLIMLVPATRHEL